MINQWLTSINDFLIIHPHAGELFAFLIAFAESLPLIGTIIPGSVTMTIIGILIGRNILPFTTTVITASIGALAGDIIGCWVGKYYNENLRSMWPFRKHPKWLSLGEDFFAKHGGKSILIGRFIGPARSTVPLIAGLLKISWARFFSAATPSAILWALAYLMPGVLVGAVSLELPPSKTTEFMLVGLVAIVLLWFLFWLIQRIILLLGDWLMEEIHNVWRYLQRAPRCQFIIQRIMHKDSPNNPQPLTLSLITLTSLICFISIWVMVITHTVLYHLNQPLFNFFQSLRTHAIDTFFIHLTMLGKNVVILSATVIIAAVLTLKKQFRGAFHVMLIAGLSAATVIFFKKIFYSARPDAFMTHPHSSSFPSGHVLLSVALFGFLAFLIAQSVQKSMRWIPYTFSIVLISLIAFSRIYLGAHWLTDILASTTLGISLLLPVIISYQHRDCAQRVTGLFWMPLLLLSFFVPWYAYNMAHFKKNEYRFTQYWPEKYTSFENWWHDPQDFLPVYRLNRFGKPTQPFNIQWAARLDSIKKQLAAEGWTAHQVKNNVKNTIQRFSSHKPEQHLPVFPWLYRHNPPELLMIKHIPHQATIIELRLWKTGIKFKDEDFPLWVGTVNYHESKQKLVSFKKPHDITLTGDGGISDLLASIKGFESKTIQIPDEDQPNHVQELDWNGSLLAIRMPVVIEPKAGSNP